MNFMNRFFSRNKVQNPPPIRTLTPKQVRLSVDLIPIGYTDPEEVTQPYAVNFNVLDLPWEEEPVKLDALNDTQNKIWNDILQAMKAG